jgi:hypothetical protein
MTEPELARHPLTVAIRPLLDRLGAELVDTADAGPLDVPLEWQGKPLAAVRLPGSEPTSALNQLLEQVRVELGGPLTELDRTGKQQAVRLLDQRGAFAIRKSVDTVAAALGVSRFTVYNYLNRS